MHDLSQTILEFNRRTKYLRYNILVTLPVSSVRRDGYENLNSREFKSLENHRQIF